MRQHAGRDAHADAAAAANAANVAGATDAFTFRDGAQHSVISEVCRCVEAPRVPLVSCDGTTVCSCLVIPPGASA